MKEHIELDVDESHTLIACLLKAAEACRAAGDPGLAARAQYQAELTIEKGMPRQTGGAAPQGYVPTDTQAHGLGLLAIWEAATLLDMRIPDLAREVSAGHIEIGARCNNLPCFTLQAIDTYRKKKAGRPS